MIKFNSVFPLGKVVATPRAIQSVPHELIMKGLTRHASGDWGDLCPIDQKINDDAVIDNHRLLSIYAGEPTPFWILTEADRSTTTVLLPDDFAASHIVLFPRRRGMHQPESR